MERVNITIKMVNIMKVNFTKVKDMEKVFYIIQRMEKKNTKVAIIMI